MDNWSKVARSEIVSVDYRYDLCKTKIYASYTQNEAKS